MAAIDTFIGYLTKFNASAIILESGKNVVLRLPTGDRAAAQTLTHDSLEKLLEECAPASVMATLLVEGKARFDYPGAKAVSVSVEASSDRFKIIVAVATPTPDIPIEIDRPGPIPIAAPPPVGPPPVGPPPVAAPVAQVLSPPPEQRARPKEPEPVAHAAPVAAPPTISISAGSGPTAELDTLLLHMKKMSASDLHLSCTMPPLVRHHGEMVPLTEHGILDPERMMRMMNSISPEKNRKEFEERNDTDFAYSIPKVSRFRVNMFRDRHGPGAVFRAIPFQLLTAEQLGLPQKVLDLCYLTKGLVVVTGPTGSGKSTTLSTLIDYVNDHRSDHIITIEDPIEFVHENKKCLVNQREVHVHTRSFKDALRAALREDPDIVLVGEMRDLETIAIAVETAETGHLVFGTLHTTTAPSTIDRIIDQFPSDRQSQVRQMLAESLRGVIAQTLCKKIGGGRVAAYEILIGNSAVSNLIRQAKTFQLFSLMQTAKNQGMITLNDSLFEHVRAKRVEPLEAYMKSVQKTEFKAMLAKIGIELNVQEQGEA